MAQSFPTRQVLARHVEASLVQPVAAALVHTAAVAVVAEAHAPLRAMVLGVDAAPRAMPVAEVAAFGDPFTSRLLLQSIVPLTLAQLAAAIEGMQGEHARPLRKLYAVAEGAAFQDTNPRLLLNARLVFTWQKDTATDPDLLLSTTADPDDLGALLQLIAWSEAQGAYHFFERLGGRWVWAGSSLDALRAASRGRGPFDSHINGGLVMKELKFPWVHWHSMARSIDRRLLFATPALDAHPLFARLEGAQILEKVVQRGVRRWTQRRMQQDLQAGRLANLRWYARQVLWTTSVNLVSSGTASAELPTVEEIALPETFFLDVDGLAAAAAGFDAGTELLPDMAFSAASAPYRATLAELGMHVEDRPHGPAVAGDTDFAFVVPERAFEDTIVLEQLIAQQVLSPRLALCLLMVDFSNPVFSPQRAGLLTLFPDAVAAGNQGAALDAVVIAAARAAPPDAAIARLLALWEAGDLLATARDELKAFSSALQDRLHTAAGVRDALRLADSRREAFRGRKLNEFRHTTAVSGAPVAHLAMDAAAQVFSKTSPLGELEE